MLTYADVCLRMQRDFLKPFDHIIANAPSPVIRELVVRCVTQVLEVLS